MKTSIARKISIITAVCASAFATASALLGDQNMAPRFSDDDTKRIWWSRREMAYQACIGESRQQEGTLDDLRSRAIGILSAVVVATSIFAAVSSKSSLAKAEVIGSVALFVVGVIYFYLVLFPTYEWAFVQDGSWLLSERNKFGTDHTPQEFYEEAITNLCTGNTDNAKQLTKLQSHFKFGLAAFFLELIVWSLSLALH